MGIVVIILLIQFIDGIKLKKIIIPSQQPTKIVKPHTQK